MATCTKNGGDECSNPANVRWISVYLVMTGAGINKLAAIMKYCTLLFYVSLFLLSCKHKCEIQNFTFLKVGNSEFDNTSLTDNFGSLLYLTRPGCNDSITIKITIDEDSVNPLSQVYRINQNEKLNSVIINFIESSVSKQNGSIDALKPKTVEIYDGGSFIISYLQNGVHKYFYFDLRTSYLPALELQQEIVNYINTELDESISVVSQNINTDSIAKTLAKLQGMESLVWPPPRIEAPPIKD